MRVTTAIVCVLWGLLYLGCSDPPVSRSAGDPCQASQECESNLCYEELCIDPAADDDGDGLTNEVEAQLGTRATLADTDGDGASDYQEVQGQLANPPNEDGDDLIDALESFLVLSTVKGKSETDGDCLAPQKDPDDATKNEDGVWVANLACCCYGACDKVSVVPQSYTCEAGEPVCVFSASDDLDGDGLLATCDDDDDGDGVIDEEDCDSSDPGRSPELTERCDGLDNDCDGETDELWAELGLPCLTAHADCGGSASFVCDADGVTCPAEPALAGTECDDGNPETLADQCDEEGNCTGIACTEGGDCTTHEVVDHACVYTVETGACFIGGVCYAANAPNPDWPCKRCEPDESTDSWTYLPSDTPCDDDDVCTEGEVCTEDAQCVGVPVVCADDHPCTTDVCDPLLSCQHLEDDGLCDDEVPCTVDTCAADAGCVFTPDDDACPSDDLCYTNTCDPTAGCVEAWAPADACIYVCDVTHVEVGTTEGFIGSSTGHAAFAGETAYVVQQSNDNEFSVVDWSDPSQPVQLSLMAEGADQPSQSVNLADVNLARRVLTQGEEHLYISSSTGVTLVDVSTPTAPVAAGHAGGTNTLYGMVLHPYLPILYAAVVSSGGGVGVVDISTPDAMSVTLPDAATVNTQTYDVALGHNALYLVGTDLGLYAYDITAPSAPLLIGQLEGVPNPTNFAETRVIVQGDLAVLVSSRDGYRLVDISDPTSLTEHSHSLSPDRNYGAVFFEGYVLLGAKPGLYILDIADPVAPVTVMATDSFSDFYGVAMVGHRVLVSTSAHLLQLYDLTLPCTDGEPCTLDTCHVLEACSFPDATCDDLDPCTTDSCTPGEGCVFQAIVDCVDGSGMP